MQQVQIPRYGGPEVLSIVEAEDPEPGPGEVRIAVRAAGINFADILARMGMYKDAPPLPAVMGYEVAGVIDAVGQGVEDHRLGQRVLAMPQFGGQSTMVVVGQQEAVELPAGMSFEQGATLPVVYLTAYHMLYYLGNLHQGERVLIHSAGGGVGLAAIQLARLRGAEIFGTASAAKHPRLTELGVDHCIDYRDQDFEQEVRRITDGAGVHVALDAVGASSFGKSYRCLAKNGRLFCFGISSLSPGKKRSLLAAASGLVQFPIFHPIKLMMENKGVFGVNLGQLWDEAEVMRGQLSSLLELFGGGQITPTVDRAFPLEQAAEAHQYIQDRKNFGKVVLTCGG